MTRCRTATDAAIAVSAADGDMPGSKEAASVLQHAGL